jgi:hypothetical protein
MRVWPLVACLLALLTISRASAQVVVTPTVTPVGAEFSYEYSVFNSGMTPIIGFTLIVTVPITGITSPTGWDSGLIPVGDETVVQWASLDPAFNIPPLGTLSGFGVTSPSAPGDVPFAAVDDQFQVFTGVTVGPVPEPTSLASVSCGILGLLRSIRRRRKDTA